MDKRDIISANTSLEHLRQNMEMKSFAKEVLLEENYVKFMKSYKFMFVGCKEYKFCLWNDMQAPMSLV